MSIASIVALALLVPLVPRAVEDAPEIDPDVGGLCRYRAAGTEMVCATNLQECPNGAFLSEQVCGAAVWVEPCPGQISVLAMAGGTSRAVLRDCADSVSPRVKLRCKCDGGLFGWCLSPCRPTGGWAGYQPCHGLRVDLVDCSD